MSKRFKLDFIFYLACCVTFFMAGINSEYRFLHIAYFYIVTMLLGIANVLVNYKNILKNKNNIFIFLYMLVAAIATALVDFNTLIHYAPSFICSACLVFSLMNKDENDFNYSRKYVSLLMVIFSLACNVLVCLSGFEDLYNQIGFISHKNVAGLINLVSFIICLNNVVKSNVKTDKIAYVLIAIVNLVFMYLSKSRTSLLCAIIFFALFIVVILKDKVKNKVGFYKYLAIILLFFVMAFVLFNKQILSFILKDQSLENAGFETIMDILLSGRYLLWFKAFPILFMNSPIIGNGIWTLNIVGQSTGAYLVAPEVLSLDYLHNFVFDSLYIGGIIGFVLLVIYFYNFFKQNKKNINSLVLINILIMFIYFMFDNTFIWSPLFSNLFLFIELGYLIKTNS